VVTPLVVLLLTLGAHVARAEDDGRPRAFAIGAAVVPGTAIHGAGHWVLGERTTARRLAIAQAIGAALGGVAAAGIGISGAAEESMPLLAIAVPGGGLFLVSQLADLYGAAGGSRLGGQPPRAPPRVEAQVGYLYLRDPHFELAHATTLSGDVWFDRVQAAAAGWFGGARTWQARGEAALRALGGRPGRPADDGSHLDVAAAASERRFGDDGFATRTFEVSVRGRYDAGRIGRTLVGSFATAELGAGFQQIRFTGDGVGADDALLFLGRFGYGVYLGDGAGRHGQVELYYHHRRDELAGGLLLPIRSNGFIGHVGVDGVVYRGRVGLGASVEAGSAWVAQVGVRFRTGGSWR
jgi:hypothetical protein